VRRRRMIDDGMQDGLWMSKQKVAIRRASRQYSTVSVMRRMEGGKGGKAAVIEVLL
jgi:hypothetical protein